MWNQKPPEYYAAKLPKLYATEKTPVKEKLIYEHLFLGSCDWYAAEFDLEDRLFFGYVILNADFQSSEWGYFGLDELEAININGFEVDRDLYWNPKKASEIEKICWGEEW